MNPERYISKSIGARHDNTHFYNTENGGWVVCGCFKGYLDEFESKVKETYKGGHKHYVEYMELIQKVKSIF